MAIAVIARVREPELSIDRNDAEATCRTVRQGCKDFWKNNCKRLPHIIQTTQVETLLGLKTSDNAATICYVFDQMVKKGVAKHLRVMYFKSFEFFDMHCMKALVKVLAEYPNIFSHQHG